MDFNRHQGYIVHEGFTKICNAHIDLPKSAMCDGTAEVRIQGSVHTIPILLKMEVFFSVFKRIHVRM